MSWKRPEKRRVRAIRDRLREMYGVAVNEPHRQPIAELIKTVLSQHTNDRNRDVAFAALRKRFPRWEEVRDAPVAELEGAQLVEVARAEDERLPGERGACHERDCAFFTVGRFERNRRRWNKTNPGTGSADLPFHNP